MCESNGLYRYKESLVRKIKMKENKAKRRKINRKLRKGRNIDGRGRGSSRRCLGEVVGCIVGNGNSRNTKSTVQLANFPGRRRCDATRPLEESQNLLRKERNSKEILFLHECV